MTWKWRIAVAIVALTARGAVADDGRIPAGSVWAVLIGAQDYEHYDDLMYPDADVGLIRETLASRAGVPSRQIAEFSGRPIARGPATARVLREEIPKFLALVPAEARVLIYFSGHGFLEADGRTALATVDADPNRPAETTLPLDELRGVLKACTAKWSISQLTVGFGGTVR